jgi:hypothetical protein
MTGSGLVGGGVDESAGCSQRDVAGAAIGQKRKLDLLNSSHRQWLLQHWKQPFEQLLRSIFDF